MGYLGFDHYEGNAVLWEVTHNTGKDFAHAPSESAAWERYKEKYPDRKIIKIERH